MSLVILLGIILMEASSNLTIYFYPRFFIKILPVVLASFAYPHVGNRKMMEICAGRLDAYQRVLGMTLASLPFWFLLSLYGFFNVGLPSKADGFNWFWLPYFQELSLRSCFSKPLIRFEEICKSWLLLKQRNPWKCFSHY